MKLTCLGKIQLEQMKVLLEQVRTFGGVYSRNNLPTIKDQAHIINLDEFKSIGTHWIVLHVNHNNVIYIDSMTLNIFQKKLENSWKTKIL